MTKQNILDELEKIPIESSRMTNERCPGNSNYQLGCVLADIKILSVKIKEDIERRKT